MLHNLKKIIKKIYLCSFFIRLLKNYGLLPDLAFHGDIILKRFLLEVISTFKVSSFIETGTHMGHSTTFVTSMKKSLKIFSCEINKDFFNISKDALKSYRNISVYNENSPVFLRNLIQSNTIGSLPLFFLDAHWYEYWPLRDELNIITSSLDKAIIIVDDVKIPGREDFASIINKINIAGVDNKNIRLVNVEMIKQVLNSSSGYDFLLPSYYPRDAFPIWKGYFCGYTVIFENCDITLFKNFLSKRFIAKNFIQYSPK